MSNLEETKEFLKKHCLQKCNHNANENCICQIALCFKEIEKTQEQLSIIKEKKVNILLLELAENVDEYNERIVPNGQLTAEEFNTLKEYVNEITRVKD